MGIIGGGGEEQIFTPEIISEEDSDGTESDDGVVMDNKIVKSLTIKNQLLTEKHWGRDENTNPAGISFKSKKLDFKKSVDK